MKRNVINAKDLFSTNPGSLLPQKFSTCSLDQYDSAFNSSENSQTQDFSQDFASQSLSGSGQSQQTDDYQRYMSMPLLFSNNSRDNNTSNQQNNASLPNNAGPTPTPLFRQQLEANRARAKDKEFRELFRGLTACMRECTAEVKTLVEKIGHDVNANVPDETLQTKELCDKVQKTIEATTDRVVKVVQLSTADHEQLKERDAIIANKETEIAKLEKMLDKTREEAQEKVIAVMREEYAEQQRLNRQQIHEHFLAQQKQSQLQWKMQQDQQEQIELQGSHQQQLVAAQLKSQKEVEAYISKTLQEYQGWQEKVDSERGLASREMLTEMQAQQRKYYEALLRKQVSVQEEARHEARITWPPPPPPPPQDSMQRSSAWSWDGTCVPTSDANRCGDSGNPFFVPQARVATSTFSRIDSDYSTLYSGDAPAPSSRMPTTAALHPAQPAGMLRRDLSFPGAVAAAAGAAMSQGARMPVATVRPSPVATVAPHPKSPETKRAKSADRWEGEPDDSWMYYDPPCTRSRSREQTPGSKVNSIQTQETNQKEYVGELKPSAGRQLRKMPERTANAWKQSTNSNRSKTKSKPKSNTKDRKFKTPAKKANLNQQVERVLRSNKRSSWEIVGLCSPSIQENTDNLFSSPGNQSISSDASSPGLTLQDMSTVVKQMRRQKMTRAAYMPMMSPALQDHDYVNLDTSTTEEFGKSKTHNSKKNVAKEMLSSYSDESLFKTPTVQESAPKRKTSSSKRKQAFRLLCQ
ncbi:PREDICTED: uncharacterized protein LOC106804927 [Priapulus caudatus]|uniref:Uncharacterized protein LOC106804927 n=1 Tax=Priapulus caudatus TaxID=37621 RepID=A0ABM1DPF0_PRICU|nr:PREDICTED: uncharacterized protein LOC106804927 [Priapulus caudatus]